MNSRIESLQEAVGELGRHDQILEVDIAALSALACCLPFGLVGALGLASIGVWIAPLRPWLLGAAVLLLVLGFWQIYRRGKQCSTQRSPVTVALFWVAVAVVVLVTIFPQLIANWLAE